MDDNKDMTEGGEETTEETPAPAEGEDTGAGDAAAAGDDTAAADDTATPAAEEDDEEVAE